jgi:hypothetical protein
MTYLEQGNLSKPVTKSEETQLALELISAMGRGAVRDQTIKELIELPSLACVHSRLAWFSGDEDDGAYGAIPRLHPKRLIRNGKNQLRPRGPGAYRAIEVRAWDLGMEPTAIDWDRLMVLAVLAQLRANLEIECETGFQRVVKCGRRACRAWYQASKMAGRLRFCGAYCRVAHSREEK